MAVRTVDTIDITRLSAGNITALMEGASFSNSDSDMTMGGLLSRRGTPAYEEVITRFLGGMRHADDEVLSLAKNSIKSAFVDGFRSIEDIAVEHQVAYGTDLLKEGVASYFCQEIKEAEAFTYAD